MSMIDGIINKIRMLWHKGFKEEEMEDLWKPLLNIINAKSREISLYEKRCANYGIEFIIPKNRLFDILPAEISQFICEYLPVTALCALRRVCSTFKNLLDVHTENNFWKRCAIRTAQCYLKNQSSIENIGWSAKEIGWFRVSLVLKEELSNKDVRSNSQNYLFHQCGKYPKWRIYEDDGKTSSNALITLEQGAYRQDYKNKRHGKGMSYCEKKDLWAEGSWKNGKKNSKFNYMKNKVSVMRYYCRGKKYGKVTMNFQNGTEYYGELDKKNNRTTGTLTYQDTISKYSGSWDMNVFDGVGTEILKNGELYSGTWKNGAFQQGYYGSPNGDLYYGTLGEGHKKGTGAPPEKVDTLRKIDEKWEWNAAFNTWKILY